MLVTPLCGITSYMQSHLFTENIRVRIILRPIREWVRLDISDPAVRVHPICATFFTSFYSKPKGEDNAGPIRKCIQPQFRDPVVWGNLVYTTFIHIFTQNVRVRKILCPIKQWIQPDISGPALWCHLVYATFLHFFAQTFGRWVFFCPNYFKSRWKTHQSKILVKK